MPKKKKGDEAPKFLGRPGTGVKVGIVGLPNVGKSTLYNCLTNQGVAAENYAFCTIEPAKAKIPVPDKRHRWLCDLYKPKKEIPAQLTVWDIAGLVKGAHEGKGLGNEFLSNIAAVDAFYHVVRTFKDKKVEHVEGEVDPVRDMQIVCDELRMRDISNLEAQIAKEETNKALLGSLGASAAGKALNAALDFKRKVLEHLKSGQWIVHGGAGSGPGGAWNNKEVEYINGYNAFTAKPQVFLVNVSRKKWLAGAAPSSFKDIKKWVKLNFKGSSVVPFSARFENDVAEAEDSAAFLAEAGVPSAIKKIITCGHKALSIIFFYTTGSSAKHAEVRSWAIRKGTLAPAAAGKIHTDIQENFICANVMNADVFKELGSEMEVRNAGKQMDEGKTYVVKDGDIITFKHQTSAASCMANKNRVQRSVR